MKATGKKIGNYFHQAGAASSGKMAQVCDAVADILDLIDDLTGDDYKIYSISSNGGSSQTNYLGGGVNPTCAISGSMVMEIHQDAAEGSDEEWFNFGNILGLDGSVAWSGSHSLPDGPFAYDKDNLYTVTMSY